MKFEKESLVSLIVFSVLTALIVFAATAIKTPNVPSIRATVPSVPSDYDTGLTYQKAVELNKPMAINFYVDWCGYCRRFAPILDSLRNDYQSQMSVVLINAEDPANINLVGQFQIEGYPSLFLVNPKNNKSEFVPQNLYADPAAMKAKFDKFINDNK